MKVCEIFAGIQGESTFAGLPCVFVRMAGCNLRCFYCDTKYAYGGGSEMSEDGIAVSVKDYGISLIEITGGEPLLQKDVLPLMERLLNEGHTVLLETNGSTSIKDVDRRAVVIMDIKTPKSGMFGQMDLLNLDHLKGGDEVKFVITDRQDYEWTKAFTRDYGLDGRCKILLSPAFDILPPAELCRWMLDDRSPARLNLQLHKYIYGPDKRGV